MKKDRLKKTGWVYSMGSWVRAWALEKIHLTLNFYSALSHLSKLIGIDILKFLLKL